MIILKKNISFVYKPKAFWMIHHNDHFIFKFHVPFMGIGNLVSHRRICKPRHVYDLSPLGTMSDHNWRVFYLRRDLSLLIDTRHIFSLPFSSTVRLYLTLSHLTEPTQSTPNAMSSMALEIIWTQSRNFSFCFFFLFLTAFKTVINGYKFGYEAVLKLGSKIVSKTIHNKI